MALRLLAARVAAAGRKVGPCVVHRCLQTTTTSTTATLFLDTTPTRCPAHGVKGGVGVTRLGVATRAALPATTTKASSPLQLETEWSEFYIVRF